MYVSKLIIEFSNNCVEEKVDVKFYYMRLNMNCARRVWRFL